MPKSATDYVKVDEENVKTKIQVMAAKLWMSIKEKEKNERELEGEGRPVRGMVVQNDDGGAPARGLDHESKNAMINTNQCKNVFFGKIGFFGHI